MSIPDSKKKRDQKSSETEKELALANLQDLFLGSKAPKADFLENTPVSISPALLPKNNIQLTSENAQNFGEHHLPLSLSNIKAKPGICTKVEEPKKEVEAETALDSMLKPRHTSPAEQPVAHPLQQPPLAAEPTETKPTTSNKPLTTFDLLAVGLDSAPEKPISKTKSFLAHFAKKISKNIKDPKDNK